MICPGRFILGRAPNYLTDVCYLCHAYRRVAVRYCAHNGGTQMAHLIRKRIRALALLSVFALVLVACGGTSGSSTTASGPETTTTAAGNGTESTDGGSSDGLPQGDLNIKVGHPSTISLYDVLSVITNDRLNAQGWNVEEVVFARTGLNPQALAQNSTQIAIIIGVESLRTFQAGGDNPKIKFVMDNNGGEFALIARAEYPTCEDFDGIRFGIHGETSSSSVAAVNFIRDVCGAEPQVLVVPGGENRIVALENDELDATLVQLSDWFELQNVADPGEYVLVDSRGSLDFNGANWWVNTDWAEANPEVATAYIAELLRTCQMIRADHSILADAVREHTEMSEDIIDLAVETYLDPAGVNLCPENGGDLTLLQGIIDYNVSVDEIDPMDAADAVHPTLLQDALAMLAGN